MDLNLFKTPTNLPFLHYSYSGVGEKRIMSLDAEVSPIIAQPSLADLDLWDTYTHPLNSNRMIASRSLCNEVARRTRRRIGNIMFVPTEADKMWFDEQYANDPRDTEMVIIVDSELEPNELRVTYWKMIREKKYISGTFPYDTVTQDLPLAVDGGFQISPEGFSCNGNGLFDRHDYFIRGFL